MKEENNKTESNQNKDVALKKMVKEIAAETVREELKSGLFTARKLTDTPTDSLSLVNRKFVTLNGVTGSRPTSSILGQYYFDTTLGRPVWWDGSTWVDADGTPV